MGNELRELTEVADFLRHVEPPLGPGELNCWDDTTHPLYLMLNLDPATRYMHYGTAFGIKSKREVIAEEVARQPAAVCGERLAADDVEPGCDQ